MSLADLTIESRLRPYEVKFVDELNFMAELSSPNLFIIDENVWALHKDSSLAGLKNKDIVLLQINEEKKNLQTVQELYREIIKREAKKNLRIISIGGGITQDITGFLCSTLYRGIQWIFVPTTLLAQADSCIGSKTSLNFDHFKNLIGTFYPPTNIYIYLPFLMTLKAEDYYSGLGEAAKLHIIGGEKAANRLIDRLALLQDQGNGMISDVIYDSLMIKKAFIENDEMDNGPRNLLNYGHCIGHALETTCNYLMPHGQAVAAGMIMANIIGKDRGILSGQTEDFLFRKLLKPVLQAKFRKISFDPYAVIEAVKKDKKRTGEGLPIVMLLHDYRLEKFSDLQEQEIINSINEFQNRIRV